MTKFVKVICLLMGGPKPGTKIWSQFADDKPTNLMKASKEVIEGWHDIISILKNFENLKFEYS